MNLPILRIDLTLAETRVTGHLVSLGRSVETSRAGGRGLARVLEKMGTELIVLTYTVQQFFPHDPWAIQWSHPPMTHGLYNIVPPMTHGPCNGLTSP